MTGKIYPRTPRNYDGTRTTSRSLSELLPVVLQQVKVFADQRSHEILEAWPKVVGEKLAPMTTATSFVNGVLTVRVKNSTLYSLLNAHDKPRLLTKLRQLFPGVDLKTILFRIG